MARPARFRWTSAACSHVGLVREINEDSCLDEPQKGLWAVADGMGGHSRGDFASRLVVESLGRLTAATTVDDFVAVVRRQLHTVNRQLREEAAARSVAVIGSTVVVLFACDGQCGYLWAGDSRLYLLRNGELTQLSRDHNQAEELRARGWRPVDAQYEAMMRNMVTRAVGAEASLELEAQTLAIVDGDMFLLCSDGLSNELGDDDIRTALLPGDCRRAAESLIAGALRHGGRDNISAVVLRVEDLDATERTVVNPAPAP